MDQYEYFHAQVATASSMAADKRAAERNVESFLKEIRASAVNDHPWQLVDRGMDKLRLELRRADFCAARCTILGTALITNSAAL